MNGTRDHAHDHLAVLRRLREQRPSEASRVGERCELCAEPIVDEHPHLVDLEARALMCACRGCYLLFTADGAGGHRYRSVPERYLDLSGEIDPRGAEWDALQIPVGVAFFFVNSTIGRVAAFYPGPAGATESLLALDTWDALVGSHPALSTLLPDVEALLVRAGRDGGDHGECYVVPIDACYELVGQMRRLWRGFDGGGEARRALDAFFVRVGSRAGVRAR